MSFHRLSLPAHLLLAAFLSISFLSGCSTFGIAFQPTATSLPTETPLPPTPTLTITNTATPIPPTSTPRPTRTATPTEVPAIPTLSPYFDYSLLPGWVAYVDFDCQKSICTNVSIIHPDGTGRVLVTDHEHGLGYNFVWAPDGKSFALTYAVMGEEGHLELRLVNIESRKERTLISFEEFIHFSDVAWSPDGRFITFTKTQGEEQYSSIFRLDLQTLAQLDLTGNTGYSDGSAVWSPDGDSLAFTSNRMDPSKGKRKIWVMNPDGTDPKMVEPDDQKPDWEEFTPKWSPDGSQLAFYRVAGENYNAMIPDPVQLVGYSENAGQKRQSDDMTGSGLWVMNGDGSQTKQLIPCSSPSTQPPLWSPDGRYIAAACGDENYSDVFVYDTLHDSYMRVNDNQNLNYSFSWSPDSKALLYIERVELMERVMHLVMFLDDGIYQTAASTFIDSPVWSPVDR